MPNFFKQYFTFQGLFLFIGETVILFGSILLATLVRFLGPEYLLANFSSILPKIILLIFIFQLVFHYGDFYDLQATDSFVKMTDKLIQSLGVSSIILAIVYYFAPKMIIGRGVFVIGIGFIVVFTFGWRYLTYFILKTKRLAKKILIVGSGKIARMVAQEILTRKDFPYEIIGFLDKNNANIGNSIINPKIIGDYDHLCEIVQSYSPDSLVVAIDDRRDGFPINELLACKLRGVSIEDHSTFLERFTNKLTVENLNPSHLIFSNGFKKSLIKMTIRRLIELLLSLLSLIILAPLILFVSLLIKIDSPGPIFFKQERVGENGRIFSIYKFRSMKQEAEEHTGPIWADENDPRITRIGRIIRKYRIDEIPQLWNVLRGDMSFVGPRPERPYFVNRLTKKIPYYNQRHSVKPGITGWAQIKYSYGSSMEDALEKLKYELYYIKNMSLFFDFFILFETVKIVLFGRGSR